MTIRPIYYDTETTGIKAERDRVVEIAAYDPVNEKTFEELVNPQIPIPSEASAVHNITDEMVANAPTFEEIAKRFIKFCEGDVVLIAHNNDGFDIHFLKHEFKRADLEFPNWKFLDTLKWARRYRPDLPKHSLQYLREIFNIPANNAHRALDDVVVLHQVFNLLLDDLTIDQAITLLNAPKSPREIHAMPFGKHQGKPLAEVPKDYVKWLAKSGAFDKEENHDLKAAFEKVGVL